MTYNVYSRLSQTWSNFNNQDMASYLGQVETLKDQFDSLMPLSESVTTQEQQRDKFFMVLALKGLRSDFSPIRDQILASSSISSLINVFARLSRIGSENNHTNNVETSVLAVKNANPQDQNVQQNGNAKNSRPFCNYCNKLGHTRQNCWKLHGRPPRTNNSSTAHVVQTSKDIDGQPSNSITLFGVDYSDYLQYKATTQQSPLSGTPQIGDSFACLTRSSPSCQWILDSGASNHISGNQNDRRTGKMIGTGYESQGLYHMSKLPPPVSFTSVASTDFLHNRFGHPSLAKLQKLIPSLSTLSSFECESCQLGKHSRTSFPERVNNRATHMFDIVHSEVLRSDNAKEYLSSPFANFMSSKGITHRPSCAYTPQQNGVAELPILPLQQISLPDNPQTSPSGPLQVYTPRARPLNNTNDSTTPSTDALVDPDDSSHAPSSPALVIPSSNVVTPPIAIRKVKVGSYGTVDRLKAHLVAKGYTQIYCLDYGDTFSAVVKIASVRLLISLAAMHHWLLHQLDIKNVFLHGELVEEVYMDQHPGFVAQGESDLVCRLKRSLYGLKRSPRAWQKIESGCIATSFVGSNDQLADILTKSLRGARIEYIYGKLRAYDMNFQLYLRKMVQNEIDDALDQLGMIKSGGDLSSIEVDQIEKLELRLRFLRTFIKYKYVLLPDSLVKITRTAQQTVEKLDFGKIPDECRTNIKTESLVSQLQEFVEGNTSSMCNFEMDDSDPTKYMDYLDKNLNDLLRLLLRVPDPDMTKEVKILKNKLTYIQKRMREKKLPKGFSHHLNSLLVYLRNKKLKNFVSAQEIDVAIEFLLVSLSDVPNHVINGKGLNEVLEKIGVVVGDILCVIKEDANKIDDAMIQILEKIEDLKADVEERYKSLKYSPSDEFPTVGGLSFIHSFLRKLIDTLKSESSSDFMMKPCIGTLDEDLSYLTSVFRDVPKVHHKDEEILKDLQRRTVNLAYEAEVSIDSILVQHNALTHFFCSLPAIIKESKQILAKVKEMSFQNLPLKPFSVVEPSKHLPIHRSNPVNDEEIVGFENESEKIIQYLIRGTHEIDVVPIVGMGGQGKTTIARKVYNNGCIVYHFDVRAWCIISQSYNRRDLLQEIFSQVTGKEDKGDKEDIIADELKKSLMGKRYLIVLDDMWDSKAWDDLRLSFPDVGNRNRIVITTRLEEVAKQVKHHIDPYSLPFLTSDDSLKLLQIKVFQQESFAPSLQDVSKAVAERCKGLPLVIVLVAGIIKRNKMEASWWYENIEESGRLEETAEGYLNDLISSNVVMVSGRRYNGKVKYCQVHDVVLHFCLNKSREEKFMLAVKGNPNRFQSSRWKDRRVSFNFTDELFSLGSKTFRQRLRSVIMTHEGNSCDRMSSQFSDMRLVKVLDLDCPDEAQIWLDIFRPLIHLKYLAVHSILDYDWVLNLPHLETLIVRKIENGLMLSTNFWKMEKLRHVETPKAIVDQYTDKKGMFAESSKLENLRIFRRVVIKEADNLDVLLRKCPNLQQLGISFMKAPTDDSTSGEDDYAKPFHINMESHTQLQSLSLFFPGSPVLGLQLPSNLKKLVLSRVPVDTAISFITGLPILEYLQLVCFHKSKEWCIPTDITFHKLKLLKLVNLCTTTWDASEESFPQLEKLVISFCCKLEEIPLSFADIPTLKQVKLIGPCADSLEASAVRIKEDVIQNEGNDRIEIITKDLSFAARKRRAYIIALVKKAKTMLVVKGCILFLQPLHRVSQILACYMKKFSRLNLGKHYKANQQNNKPNDVVEMDFERKFIDASTKWLYNSGNRVAPYEWISNVKASEVHACSCKIGVSFCSGLMNLVPEELQLIIKSNNVTSSEPGPYDGLSIIKTKKLTQSPVRVHPCFGLPVHAPVPVGPGRVRVECQFPVHAPVPVGPGREGGVRVGKSPILVGEWTSGLLIFGGALPRTRRIAVALVHWAALLCMINRDVSGLHGSKCSSRPGPGSSRDIKPHLKALGAELN
ncbi:putative late blight resistance protein -like protein R1B-14 isoform 2 [Capsicum annuum]|nr:putative late blight resistance protein -like protein R1B-14 isoform 2 [Capsicum annuum]